MPGALGNRRGHFQMVGMADDPWIPIKYYSDADGNAKGEIIMADFTAAAVDGLVVVVHDGSGMKVACSKLVPFSSWYAHIGDYPGVVTGGPTGYVQVKESTDGISLKGVFSGVEMNVTGGWHIHSGTTCDNSSLVGGHFQMPDMASDPWIPIKYYSDVYGEAIVEINSMVDFTMAEVINKPIVVHNQAGNKVGCGEIFPVPQAWSAKIGNYPGYTSSNIGGVVDVSQEETGILLSYQFSGLDVESSAGWHVHIGTSCDDSSLVGDHYWPILAGPSDPQTSNQYTSDIDGLSSGTLSLANFALFDVMNRAIVVHSSSARIGCGLILPKLIPTDAPTVSPPVVTTEAATEANPEDDTTEAASTYKLSVSIRCSYQTPLTQLEKEAEEKNIETTLKNIFGTLTVVTVSLTPVARRRLLGFSYHAACVVSGVSEAAAQTDESTMAALKSGVANGSSQNVTVTVDPFVTEAETEPPSASPTSILNPYINSAQYYSLSLGYLTVLALMFHW